MSALGNLLRWFAGGSDGYTSLVHCMRGDTFWIVLTVLLDVAVALGYLMIARHWWINERSLPDSQAKHALGNMKRIFLLCGTCGYLFIPIKMYWPAWRLYDFFLIGLVYFTWQYALNTRQLRVVYHELGRTKQLAFELEVSRAESKRKSFFLNAISHDLRTPLNGLMLQADLAEISAGGDDPETLRESLREIKACAKSTADLLGSFLELGRLDWSEDSARPTRFPLRELVDQVVDSAISRAELKNLQMRVEVPRGLHLRTDRVKLERILQNLVGNAVKFTERGFVAVEARVDGLGVVLTVTDTGVGIAPEVLKTIFEEFYQVNNSERDRTKGFGLGLSIARRLARLLKGDLTVESEVGRGSRFAVALPDVVDQGVDPPARSGQATPAAG
jgi:signal transduction histidine kinase